MNFTEYIKENRAEFIAKVNSICDDLRIKPDWLMFVMWFFMKLETYKKEA